jgi:hypothetical protein
MNSGFTVNSIPYQASPFFAESLPGYHGLLDAAPRLVFRGLSCHRFDVRGVIVMAWLSVVPLLGAMACGRGTLDLRGSPARLNEPDAAPARANSQDAGSPAPPTQVKGEGGSSQPPSEPPPDDLTSARDEADGNLDDDNWDESAEDPSFYLPPEAGVPPGILCSDQDPPCDDGLLCNYMGYCVQCISDNQCVEGLVCNYLGWCSPGCRSDRDCGPGRLCNEFEMCVGQRCRRDEECPGFMMCLDGACEVYPPPPPPDPSADPNPFDDAGSGGVMTDPFADPAPSDSSAPLGAGGMMSMGAGGSSAGSPAPFSPLPVLDAGVLDASL